MTLTEDYAVPPGDPARRGWITPVLSVVGTIALLVVLGTAAFQGVRVFAGGETVRTASVAGVDTLDIRASAASFTLEYANVTEASLTVRGSSSWTLEREGSNLVVRPPARWFGSWFGAEEKAVLTLPLAMRTARLDALLSLSAGELRASGEFGILQLTVAAGDARVEGAAQAAEVKVSAGQANVSLRDVGEVTLDVSAGQLIMAMHGTTPQAVAVKVSAGKLDLVVPDSPYALSSDVSAGSFDYSIVVDSRAAHRITVRVSAGQVLIRPAS